MVMIKADGKLEESRTLGRRKCASARVKLTSGKGQLVVNDRPFEVYFPHLELREIILAPLKALAKEKNYDISVRVIGGGKMGQASAVRLGIARALIKWNTDFKKTLKTQGFLTCDARVKERKKFGFKKARRAPQWRKR